MLKNVLQICLVCVLNGILTYGQIVQKDPPTKWSTNILQEGTSVIALQTIEPGFDLTDDEITKFKLWPQGIVSYYIDDFSFDKVLRDRIRSVLDGFSGLTGLRFMELYTPPLDGKARWILFLNRRGLLGCADHNVMNFTDTGIQKVVLGYDCIYNGAELSEVALAIAGVPPQHNSPDRDDYITVHMDKVIPEKRYLFKKLQNSDWLFHDLEYDFTSESHYHFHKHTIDGSATIVPKEIVDVRVGEGDGLSYTDVLKVRMLYNYISRKKYSSVKAPECNKLFKPGSNFGKYQQKEDNVKPRVKPNKYLGRPDDDDRTDKSKLKDDKQNEDEQESSNDQNRNDEEIITVNTRSPEGIDDNSKNEKDGKENDSDVNARNLSITLLKVKQDPFKDMSDYETSDEKTRMRLKGKVTTKNHSYKTNRYSKKNKKTE